MSYTVTLGRTLSNQAYGGLPFETTRLELQAEGEDFEDLADEVKAKMDEWVDMMIQDIETEAWDLTTDEWEALDDEVRLHLQDAKRALGRVRYHKNRAQIIQLRKQKVETLEELKE